MSVPGIEAIQTKVEMPSSLSALEVPDELPELAVELGSEEGSAIHYINTFVW